MIQRTIELFEVLVERIADGPFASYEKRQLLDALAKDLIGSVWRSSTFLEGKFTANKFGGKIAGKCSIFLHQLYFFLWEGQGHFLGIRIKFHLGRAKGRVRGYGPITFSYYHYLTQSTGKQSFCYYYLSFHVQCK